MKTLMLATAAVLVATAVSLPPAHAEGPRASSSNAVIAAADGSQTATAMPRYQWQYHYAGSHARWEGYWAPAK